MTTENASTDAHLSTPRAASGESSSGPATSRAGEYLLEARGVTKSFGHVEVLRGVDFDVRPNEITALIGDNGAGKSTLIKILSGALRADGGEFRFRGDRVDVSQPGRSREWGIETVYQDLALAPDLTSVANLFLGRERVRGGVLAPLGLLDRKAMRREADDAFRRLGTTIKNSGAEVSLLSGGQRQAVAISRAAMWATSLIYMDEPTAALGVVQTKHVLELIERTRAQGMSVVLISHSMPEVLAVADRVQVLRLGRRVANLYSSQVGSDDLVAAMTGAKTFTEEAS